VLTPTLLVLGSAALHATWNLLIKTSEDRLLAAWGQFLVGGLVFVPLLVVVDPPGAEALPFLLGSSLVHVVYIVALTSAYAHGDFSVTYPLARGGGALIAAGGGVLFLGDALSGWAWLAIAIVVGGLASLARRDVATAALAWAGLTAATIGVYTTLDIEGARRSSGLGYGIVLVLGAARSRNLPGSRSKRRLQNLGECRMDIDGLRDDVDRQAEAHDVHRLLHEHRCVMTDDVTAQDLARARIGQHLDEAVVVIDRLPVRRAVV